MIQLFHSKELTMKNWTQRRNMIFIYIIPNSWKVGKIVPVITKLISNSMTYTENGILFYHQQKLIFKILC